MEAKYIQHMGNDLTVVNAARVSFNKKSEWSHEKGEGKPVGAGYPLVLKEGDRKLVNYLAKHNHWTPFAHTSITIHLKMSLFVARQIDKHQVGFTVNEVSRRYVDYEPELYTPYVWRKRPEDGIKQGSSEEAVEDTFGFEFAVIGKNTIQDATKRYQDSCLEHYNRLLEHGVCPEQARMVLPQSMYTEQWKTGSLVAWSRLCKLRLDPHAQKETRELAEQIDAIIAPLFPVAWKALLQGE